MAVRSADMRSVDTGITSLARNWWAIALRGVAAVIFGVLTFILPGITLAVLILLFGSYAVVDGVFNIIAAMRGRVGDQPRWLLAGEGVVSILAGLITFVFPGLTALVLVYVIGAWAVVTGVLKIIAAIRMRNAIRNEWWLAASGVLSVVFGALVMLFPGTGALAMVLWIGAYAIVFGALLIALAVRLRNHRDETRVPMARAA